MDKTFVDIATEVGLMDCNVVVEVGLMDGTEARRIEDVEEVEEVEDVEDIEDVEDGADAAASVVLKEVEVVKAAVEDVEAPATVD